MTREKIIEIICDIYEEYNISNLGFDLFNFCKKAGIKMIPYSKKEKDSCILEKFDSDSFSAVSNNGEVCICYNDKVYPSTRIKFSIPHELGHIMLNHCFSNESSYILENDADLFAKEFYCPRVLLLEYKITSVQKIRKVLGVSHSYAEVIRDNLLGIRKEDYSKNEMKLLEIFKNNKKAH